MFIKVRFNLYVTSFCHRLCGTILLVLIPLISKSSFQPSNNTSPPLTVEILYIVTALLLAHCQQRFEQFKPFTALVQPLERNISQIGINDGYEVS